MLVLLVHLREGPSVVITDDGNDDDDDHWEAFRRIPFIPANTRFSSASTYLSFIRTSPAAPIETRESRDLGLSTLNLYICMDGALAKLRPEEYEITLVDCNYDLVIWKGGEWEQSDG